MPNDDAGYKGSLLLLWNGEFIIEKSQYSEPDGHGGRLIDLWIRPVNGGPVVMHPNMHTNIIEDCLV